MFSKLCIMAPFQLNKNVIEPDILLKFGCVNVHMYGNYP